jgi:hypothetical protein
MATFLRTFSDDGNSLLKLGCMCAPLPTHPLSLYLSPSPLIQGLEAEATFYYCCMVKSSLNWFEWNLPPHATMQLTDWLLVEVAFLLIGLTQISFAKTGFDRLGRDQSSFRLSAL